MRNQQTTPKEESTITISHTHTDSVDRVVVPEVSLRKALSQSVVRINDNEVPLNSNDPLQTQTWQKPKKGRVVKKFLPGEECGVSLTRGRHVLSANSTKVWDHKTMDFKKINCSVPLNPDWNRLRNLRAPVGRKAFQEYRKIKFLVDSGAAENVVPPDLFRD